ncbi:hypothetical protein ACN3XK_48815 [Actinomadura welshii]
MNAFFTAHHPGELAIKDPGGVRRATSVPRTNRQHGWAVVRGISDDANPAKNNDHHTSASWHATTTLPTRKA